MHAAGDGDERSEMPALNRRGEPVVLTSRTVPETPITLAVPPVCPHCGSERVQLQQNIHGNRVLLEWCCQDCKAEWVVRHKDEYQTIRRRA